MPNDPVDFQGRSSYLLFHYSSPDGIYGYAPAAIEAACAYPIPIAFLAVGAPEFAMDLSAEIQTRAGWISRRTQRWHRVC